MRPFRAALEETYGARLAHVVLFGSRARGDAHAESDYDVAVVLHGMSDHAQEMNHLADLATAFIRGSPAELAPIDEVLAQHPLTPRR